MKRDQIICINYVTAGQSERRRREGLMKKRGREDEWIWHNWLNLWCERTDCRQQFEVFNPGWDRHQQHPCSSLLVISLAVSQFILPPLVIFISSLFLYVSSLLPGDGSSLLILRSHSSLRKKLHYYSPPRGERKKERKKSPPPFL